jgi:hypothetical protein
LDDRTSLISAAPTYLSPRRAATIYRESVRAPPGAHRPRDRDRVHSPRCAIASIELAARHAAAAARSSLTVCRGVIASGHRPGPAAGRQRARPRHHLRHPRGAFDLGRPLGHGAEHLPVVELLEALAAGVAPRDLAHQQEHRRRVLEGGVHADAHVRRARPAGDEADPRPARELAVGLGHVRGTRLVAGDDQADGGVVQRVEHREVALARDAEGDLRPVALELVAEDLRARARHVAAATGCSRKIRACWVLGFSASAGST